MNMGLFRKKTKVADFYSAQEIQSLRDDVTPLITARLIDFNARMHYQSFINMADDGSKALNRDDVSHLFTAAEGFAKADPSYAAALQNGIEKMKAWLDDPSNH